MIPTQTLSTHRHSTTSVLQPFLPTLSNPCNMEALPSLLPRQLSRSGHGSQRLPTGQGSASQTKSVGNTEPAAKSWPWDQQGTFLKTLYSWRELACEATSPRLQTRRDRRHPPHHPRRPLPTRYQCHRRRLPRRAGRPALPVAAPPHQSPLLAPPPLSTIWYLISGPDCTATQAAVATRFNRRLYYKSRQAIASTKAFAIAREIVNACPAEQARLALV